ncbi:hypothetical protein Tco_0602632, partial [Tanacetum coccineum]
KECVGMVYLLGIASEGVRDKFIEIASEGVGDKFIEIASEGVGDKFGYEYRLPPSNGLSK